MIYYAPTDEMWLLYGPKYALTHLCTKAACTLPVCTLALLLPGVRKSLLRCLRQTVATAL